MSAVFQLFGFPGTGKLTIGREIVRQLVAADRPATLLDNHSTSNLVWSLVTPDRRFDEEVMAHMAKVRAALLTAAEALAEPERSFVFTNFLPAGRDRHVADGHRDLALRMGRRFVAVALTCDRDDVLARVESPERAANMKVADRGLATMIMDAGQTLPTHWPELTELDITGLTPEESAARVIALAD